MPPTVGMACSSGKVSWRDLSTDLGLEDLHDVLEIVRVDAHNARILAKRAERERSDG